MDDYSEYINQLPDAESPTHDTSNVTNNIDQYADQVGAAVADRLGPLLGAAAQGITDRLDVLNKIAARLLLQVQTGTTGAGVPTRVGLASGTNRQNGTGAPTAPRACTPTASGGTRVNSTIPQYEYVGGPAEAGLRKQINNYCNEVDRAYFDGVAGKANKAVFCAFNFKSRTQMALRGLEEVMDWVRDEWPIE